MKFKFENGKIIKIDTHYYSRTHVSGGPGLLSQTEISSSSEDACKVDVWIKGEDREFCIPLEQPFKALPGHDVTISYTESGTPIQLINNSTGQAIWFSYKARRAYKTATEPSIFETKSAFICGIAIVELIFIYLPLLLVPVSGSLIPVLWTLGALVYFGRKAAKNLNGGWKHAAVIYSLPVLILPLFASMKGRGIVFFGGEMPGLSLAAYFFLAFIIILVGKTHEKINFEPKEHGSIGYEAAKALHYQQVEAK